MERAQEESLSRGMHELKRKVSEIENLIPRDAPLLYCDFPIHLNFGDILIMLGTIAFLKQLDNPVIDSFTLLASQKLQQKRPQEAVWLLHGGGNFGDLWPEFQNFRERVIVSHPGERIIGLPQTMHYASPDALKRFAAIAAGHKDLHLFWRDRVSYETARQHFDCHNYLCPDMAHSLWPLPAHSAAGKPARDLYLIRRDKEAGVLPAWVEAHRGEFVDWRDLVPVHYQLARRSSRLLDKIGGASQMRVPTLAAWSWAMRRLLAHMIRRFRDYDRVVTSRLHAHIFASLLGKQTVLIDNSYGKNRTYFEAWTRNLGTVEFAATEDIGADGRARRAAV